jgi:uncharacterized protein
MAIKILQPQQWQTQRWQNGGGITHQLCRADDDKGMRWRISIAEVASDGPFSQFDNIDRIIMLLEGDGFLLHGVADTPMMLARALQPYAFAGETAIQCQLIAGPVRDFNLMTRRHDVAVSLEVLYLDTEAIAITLAPESFIYVFRGVLTARLEQHCITSDVGDMLCLTDETNRCWLSAEKQAQVILIRLN